MFGVNPEEVFIANTRRGGYAYHTTTECPHIPAVTRTLTEGDPEFERVLEARDECQWCRYDTIDTLGDGNGDNHRV